MPWRGDSDRKTADSLRISGLMWCYQESNRGHKDFQSFALPTELWHRFVLCTAKLEKIFDVCKFFCQYFGALYVFSCVLADYIQMILDSQ